MFRMVIPLCILLVIGLSPDIRAEQLSTISLSIGQEVYVPSYTQLHRTSKTKIDSVTTLSIHNVDKRHEIVVTSAIAYATNGDQIKQYITEPLTLKSFASKSFVGPYKDGGDGTGANFVVTWTAKQAVVPPIVETLLLANTGNQGFSLSSRGRVIAEKKPKQTK